MGGCAGLDLTHGFPGGASLISSPGFMIGRLGVGETTMSVSERERPLLAARAAANVADVAYSCGIGTPCSPSGAVGTNANPQITGGSC
jgi:hypothetical protein